MNIYNFFTVGDYGAIKDSIESRKTFEHKKSAKGGGNEITVRLDGRFIDEECARKVWNGHDYLVGVQIDYHGKMGIGGSGFAIDKFERFVSWDSFREWMDSLLKRFDSYEIEEFGQLCLF